MTELRAAADRLAAALSDVDAEEVVAEFKDDAACESRFRSLKMIILDANILIRAVLGNHVRQP
jgi:hypothetical protein